MAPGRTDVTVAENGNGLHTAHNGVSNGTSNGTNGTLHTSDGTNGSAKTASNGVHSHEDVPIAIVGMGLRLPGGIGTEEDLWDTLINKKDQRQRVPADRWNVDAFYSKTNKRGTVKTEHGYFLADEDLQQFDTSFFSITRNELEKLDPQHRLLLEVTRECLENAGELDWRGKDIGCYVGVFGEDWLDLHAKDSQDFGIYRITGAGDFVLANRISYEYDLKGPSITVKTACSSALICLHMACDAIRSGEISSAIVGGANLLMSPTMTIAMSEQGVLSGDGSCKTFDAAADGYARAEAVNALYIKRLDHAIRDGNPIRGIVRGTGSNCDGKTAGLSHPSPESHEALIRRTYEQAGIDDFCQTAFVECHGTGTATGDPLETSAIGNVFGEKGVYITSVKPNVGHSEGASGITSCIKAILAMEKKTIPPNIKFNNPNPQIPFKKAKLQVPVEPTPWPQDRQERVSINAFGIGGANAHAIIDSAESYGVNSMRATRSPEKTSRQSLVVFSANHMNSARNGTANLQEYLTKHPGSVKDLAYTTGVRRERLPYRSFAVSDGSAPLEFTAPSRTPATAPQVTFVFTGQGAQWATMSVKLMEEFPSVEEDFKNLDKALSQLPYPPSWSIADELLKPQEKTRLDQAEFSQPLCTAVQLVIVNLLRAWNISPSRVIGHSSGELAAAYASGAITAEEAIIGAYYRGLVTKEQTRPGAMAAVGFGREDVACFLTEGVTIACENSPASTTLSGDADKIDAVIAKIKESHPDVLARRLRVEMAYHSYHMTEVGAKYQELLEPHVSSARPEVSFYSTVLEKVITEKSAMNASYWRRNMESPVLFDTTMAKLLADESANNLFLEIGPHSALAGPLRQIFKKHQPDALYVPTLVRGHNDMTSLLSTAGNLFVKGLAVDIGAVNDGGSILTDLPTYPWHHEDTFWDESRLTREWRKRKFPRHDLLGCQVFEGSSLEPTWRNMLCLEDVPWIRDHVIGPDIVFPGAGYIAMAGEAIRQVADAGDYTVRNLSVKSAMILHEPVTTEILFSLRPHRLTTSLDSTWYEFTVSSHNGTAWTKHCTGQVKAGRADSESVSEPPQATALPRKVSSTRWYQTMSKVGINYGPTFQGLEDVSAHPVDNFAVAKVTNTVDPNESAYQLHPTTTDYAIQLFSVAAWKGQARDFVQMPLPAYFGEVYMKRPQTNEQLQLSSNVTVTARGAVHGDGFATVGGDVVLEFRNLRLAPAADDTGGDDQDPHAGVRLQWKPDIAFLDSKDLIRTTKSIRSCYSTVQRLLLLCSIECTERLASLPPSGVEHLEKFKTWLASHVEQAKAEGYEAVDGVNSLFALSRDDRLSLIETTAQEVKASYAEAVGNAIRRVFENIEGIFTGEADALDLLMQDDILRKIYDLVIEFWDFKDFLGLVSHDKPNLKVLEIGAGTGATTALILDGLVSELGEQMFYSYTYTDISAGFFAQAKERFKNVHSIEYAVLDISQDPAEQGFELGSYDLVIATNVLHATPSLQETLVNVLKLLQPKGKLMLQELCSSTKWFNFIVGVLPGWWLGEPDGRPEEPYASPERWARELTQAGFDGAEAVIYDEEKPYHTNATIIAHPLVEPKVNKKVSILSTAPNGPTATLLAQSLARQNFTVDFCSLDDTPKSDHDIISALDLEGRPFLTDISADKFHSLQTFITKLASSGMLWLTRSAQMNSSEPEYAQIVGLARSVRNELSIDLATVEMDNTQDETTFFRVIDILSKFQNRSKNLDIDPEFEYAISNGVINISRFHWISVSNELAAGTDSTAPKTLEIGKRGSLKTLRWVQRPEIKLTGDEVAVKVRAAGMNFKDILISMGIVDGNVDDGNGLGCECAGVVTQVGPDAPFHVGDRVAIIGGDSYSTVLKTTSALCARIPDNLSFEDAATMPCVYTTVIHSLLDLARIEKDQAVLIQSACGGIGIAAINICRMVGAKIFATVGSQEKIDYLMSTFGIPRDHIFNSRNSSFLPDVMRETNGVGVDVVLNSLSGDLLHASWKCVAEFGKMVEIGKRDFIGQGKLAMEAFEANRTFYGVDFAPIAEKRPYMIKRLLGRTMEFFRLGAIQPIRPIKFFGATQIEDALRYMQKGQHMGKLVIQFPTDHSQLTSSRGNNRLVLRSDASYLLVGGLGGLGRSISTWMVEHGARHFIYLSRSGGKGPDDAAFVQEMDAAGCTVQITAGSVANLADVQRAINQAEYPIAGVLQMSMVLRDASFPSMTHDEWQAANLPKIKGTWNLHEAFASQPLDFFVLFSSFSGLLGHWGQANYAAANTFLDAFAQYRHGLGLPASVLDISIIEDVSWVSQEPGHLEQLKATAAYCLKEQHLLDSLELAITKSAPQAWEPKSSMDGYMNASQIGLGMRMMMPIAADSNRCIWKRDIRMGLYRNLENSGVDDAGTGNEGLREFLTGVTANPESLKESSSVSFLANEIGSTLFSFLMRPIEELDVKQPLSAVGLDSLVAIELRNWSRQRLGVELSVLEILGAASIEKLGEAAAEGLLVKLGGAATNGDAQ
ncbi:hypothetical protein NW757_004776 [Fusarium falciforme]|nr:hypothetical protein NW757_004776 [Fusarium falciforme]